MQEITVKIPATIANVCVGFDVMGLALAEPFDLLKVQLKDEPGIELINEIEGVDMPLTIDDNCASVSALEVLKVVGKPNQGIKIYFIKKIRPGSGLGSSAASAAGAAYAVNELLGRPLTTNELIPYAMAGEEVASKAWHADNVAPAILGGFTLIRENEPLDIVQVPYPSDLRVIALHPEIVIKTSEARAVLPEKIPMGTGAKQWANLGAFVVGLATEDFGLISRSMNDYVAEPYRAKLIPGFDELKHAAIQAGALGFGISGSGPTVFAFVNGLELADQVYRAMGACYTELGVAPFDIYNTSINQNGPVVVD